MRLYILQFKMKTALFFAVLVVVTLQATHFRLNTAETTTLNVGDSLISTLGHFKATLLETGCVLSVESLTPQDTYVKQGNYSSDSVSGNCRSLVIEEGRIRTDSDSTFLEVGTSYNLTTIFTIDDWGVMRLIGTYRQPNFVDQVSEEVLIEQFKITRTNETNYFPASELTVGFIDTFEPYLNKRDWEYFASLGQLDIRLFSNPGITISYTYARFLLNNSLILDFNGDSFPKAIFPNITFQPRCTGPRIYLNYKPPFVFHADPYWPIFTLYEQGRYKVFTMSYNQLYGVESWQQNERYSFRQEAHPCPPFTFEFKGNCVSQCPYPYYYQMRNQHGYCVLTCEQFTPINQTTRVCSCLTEYESPTISSTLIKQCPSDATSYPYGCYCTTDGQYFDRKLSFSCVSNCPQATFAHNGLCMNCPARCLTCQIDNFYRSFLECRECEPGYSVQKGQCFKDCSPGLGLSEVNGVCQECTDPNCLSCTQSVGTCTQCNLLYSVSNGTCVQTCGANTVVAHSQTFDSVCLPEHSSCSSYFASYYKTTPSIKCVNCRDNNLFIYNDRCVSQCPQNYTANSQRYCYCSGNGLITVDQQCLQMPWCPIEMGWDSPSQSCMSCQFSCITCHDGACTECIPGFFLYVSPQTINCRRKSPLFPCDQQYGLFKEVCLVLDHKNPRLGLTRCFVNIPNCKACQRQSESLCSVCEDGYFNHNNTCIASCPQGTIPYRGTVCITPQIPNCQEPYLAIASQPFVLNYDRVINSQTYKLYTFNGRETPNDPVGYIPIFQQLTERKNDGQFRDSEFFHPVWTCLKCIDGMGLSDDHKSCLACPQPCLTCYQAKNTSCLTVEQAQVCKYYIQQTTGNCVQSCGSSDWFPNRKNGILYCSPSSQSAVQEVATIDSAVYVSADGTKHVFFVLDEKVDTADPINVNVVSEPPTPLLASDGRLATTNTRSVPLSSDFVAYHDTDPNNNVYMLNVTDSLDRIVTSEGSALSNAVYGVETNQSHPEFMKTWLAYIGYIMGIVLILLHAVFVGNDLLYKVDNAIILGQTIYFFSFVQLLVGRLLSQFYYGWIFTHFGFFPNFFEDTIPSEYIEVDAPSSYKLATLDANVVRNAGFAMSLLLVFIGAYALITLVCLAIHKCCEKPDVWHPKIAVNSLIAGVEFISMSLFFWSVANLLYIGNSDLLNAQFHKTSKAVSIFWIVLIALYTLVRWFFNPLGGLYMAKRILLATILAASYLDKGMMAPLLLLETVFTVFRFFMESPQRKREQIMLGLQWLIYVGVYLLLWLCLDAGVNTIIISIVMFIIIVVLAHDLTEVYLESQNEWELEQGGDDSSTQSMAKAQAESGAEKRMSSIYRN